MSITGSRRAPPTGGDPELKRVLGEAHWHLLRGETSCNLYWGEAWVWRAHKDLDDVAWHLGEARAILGPEPPLRAQSAKPGTQATAGAEHSIQAQPPPAAVSATLARE